MGICLWLNTSGVQKSSTLSNRCLVQVKLVTLPLNRIRVGLWSQCLIHFSFDKNSYQLHLVQRLRFLRSSFHSGLQPGLNFDYSLSHECTSCMLAGQFIIACSSSPVVTTATNKKSLFFYPKTLTRMIGSFSRLPLSSKDLEMGTGGFTPIFAFFIVYLMVQMGDQRSIPTIPRHKASHLKDLLPMLFTMSKKYSWRYSMVHPPQSI